MRLPQRRARIVILALLFASVVTPLVLLSVFHIDPSSSTAQRELIGETSGTVKNLPPLIKQEADEGLKEPVRKVKNLEDRAKGGELQQYNASASVDGQKQGLSNQTTVGELNECSGLCSVANDKVSEMEDQLTMAKVYLSFEPLSSIYHLVRELKLRVREIERVLAQASKDSDLSRTALQRMRAMVATLSKVNKSYSDCNAMASKLRAMIYATAEKIRAERNQASYFIQLAARTFPKGLHCLSMQLTMEYFNLLPEECEFPNRHKVQNPYLYHYAIFSDNIVACAVVVNSTVSNSLEPEKIVFHVVTDSLNFPAMLMWFLINPPGQATIDIESLNDFQWLPSDYNSMFQEPGARDLRYTLTLNHLHFYLPEVFPFLNKVLLLDHDVVVQRNLRELWDIDMKGKVNAATEKCRTGDLSHWLEMLVDFSDPSIEKSFDTKACIWAYGMNMFDLLEWRRQGLTSVYHKWLQVERRQQLWKAESLPLGQLVFYNHTLALNRQWHVFGLGHDPNVGRSEVESAAVIHYDGSMKPWLDIGIPKYRGYWSKFLKYDHPYLEKCNIHAAVRKSWQLNLAILQ